MIPEHIADIFERVGRDMHTVKGYGPEYLSYDLQRTLQEWDQYQNLIEFSGGKEKLSKDPVKYAVEYCRQDFFRKPCL